MASVNYTNMEKLIIRNCKEMGYSSTQIANFVNKKEHAGQSVRSGCAIRNLK